MFKNIGYSRGQIFTGSCLTPHAVLQDESIISFLAQLYGVRETLMNRSDVGKATARTHDGKWGPRPALE